MKIHWGRILIAGICSEMLLFAIGLISQYAESDGTDIIILIWFAISFLGGIWVAYKIEDLFLLHGVLVGIVACLLFILLEFPIMRWIDPTIDQTDLPVTYLAPMVISCVLRMLGGTLGAFIIGVVKTNLQRKQGGK